MRVLVSLVALGAIGCSQSHEVRDISDVLRDDPAGQEVRFVGAALETEPSKEGHLVMKIASDPVPTYCGLADSQDRAVTGRIKIGDTVRIRATFTMKNERIAVMTNCILLAK